MKRLWERRRPEKKKPRENLNPAGLGPSGLLTALALHYSLLAKQSRSPLYIRYSEHMSPDGYRDRVLEEQQQEDDIISPSVDRVRGSMTDATGSKIV